MGKGIKAKPKKQKKIYTLDSSDIRKIKQEITERLMILTAACYMDTELVDEEKQCYIPCADEYILDFWERLQRYVKGVDEHLVSIDYVKKVIQEGAKLEINW